MENAFALNDAPINTGNELPSVPKSILEKAPNPFEILVSNPNTIQLPSFADSWKPSTNAPITVSTKMSEDYIKKGFNINDLDLNPKLEQDLSSTQGRTDRLINNLKVAGANFASMAIATGFSSPISTGINDLESGIAKDLFDWSKGVAENNRNFETKEDSSDNIWTNLNNWLNPTANSTKGFGKILESTAYGLGAGLGIAGQELAISTLTGGVGTVPLLARNIQKLLNSAKYLDRALEVSGIAIKGANNLEKVVRAGEVSTNIAKGLQTLYRSQLGAYSEALFEGLEGKETLKEQLIKDFEEYHGYTPTGKELNKIEEHANEAGLARLNVNRALLSLTNISQYNSVFKSVDAIRESAESLAEKYGSKIAFENGRALVKDELKDSILKSAWFNKGIGKALNVVATTAVNIGKKEAVKEGLQEGMEEGLQFLTDKIINNYYTWKYKGDNKNIVDAISEGSKELFSKEGVESIFTGALAGGGQSLVTNFLTHLSPKYKAGKIQYNKNQEELTKQYNELADKWESLSLDTKKKIYNSFKTQSVRGDVTDSIISANASTQIADMKDKVDDNEQFNQLLMHELFTLALPYVRNGNVDILKQQFNDMNSLDEESFQKMFGVEADKKQLIEYYNNEFDKINEAYRKVNNAFNVPFKDDVNYSIYNHMKHELAFSLYNSERMIEDAKTIESGLGIYKDILNNYAINLPSAYESNNKRIKEIDGELEIDNNNKSLKEEKQGLENINQYIDSVLTQGKEFTKEGYLRQLNKNVIVPYFNARNVEIPDQFKQFEDLSDALNKTYHLAKIKDRINYQQDKINKILYSDNPVTFFNKSERELEELLYKQNKKAKEATKIKEQPVVSEEKTPSTVVPETSKKELNTILSTEEQLLPEETEIPEIQQPEEIIPDNIISEIETTGESNITSKLSPVVYMVDDEGNVLDGEQDFVNRAKIIQQLSLGILKFDDFINNLEFSYVDNIKANNITFPDEQALIRDGITRGINVKYKDIPITLLPLDETLYVDGSKISSSIPSKMLYSEFLQLCKSNYSLFEKSNEIKNGKPVLFNGNKSLDDLILESVRYNNNINNLRAYLNDDNTIKPEVNNISLRNYLKLQLSYTTFFSTNEKAFTGYIPLNGSALEDNPVLNIAYDEIDGKYSFEYIGKRYDSLNNEIKSFLQSLANKGIKYNGRIIYYKLMHSSGVSTPGYISAQSRDIELYDDVYNTPINSLEDLRNANNKFYISSEDNIVYTNKEGVVKQESLGRGVIEVDVFEDNNRYDIKLSIADNSFNIKVEKQDIKTTKDFVNIIKSNIKSISNNKGETLKTKDVRAIRKESTKEATLQSRDTILVPSYFKRAKRAVFTTTYFRLKPSSSSMTITPVVQKFVTSSLDEKIKDVEKRRQEELNNIPSEILPEIGDIVYSDDYPKTVIKIDNSPVYGGYGRVFFQKGGSMYIYDTLTESNQKVLKNQRISKINAKYNKELEDLNFNTNIPIQDNITNKEEPSVIVEESTNFVHELDEFRNRINKLNIDFSDVLLSTIDKKGKNAVLGSVQKMIDAFNKGGDLLQEYSKFFKSIPPLTRIKQQYSIKQIKEVIKNCNQI